jgi:hypothetical protein
VARTDIHRPSAINPDEYEFVGFDYLRADDLGAALFLAAERENIRNHRARTGGTYSQHEHGGNCHICGSVNAIYTATFYHKPTNTYIKTGLDCAEKLECEGIAAFKKKVTVARERKAGRQKAIAILSDHSLLEAWEIFIENDVEKTNAFKYEEITIRDIVGNLVRYGNISDKAIAFLHRLLENISSRARRAAEWAAKKAAALPIPESYTTGRKTIYGKVLSLKEQESNYGPVTKMLVEHEDGWKLYGNRPKSLSGAAVGDTVQFDAGVQVSKDDPKFGFFSRPNKGVVISEPVKIV